MKTKILFGVLALAVVASCSKNEVLETNGENIGNKISFRTAVGKQTKGAEASLTSLQADAKGFRCIGLTTVGPYADATVLPITHFSGSMIYAAGSGTWEITPEPYWPETTLKLSVFGYYPQSVIASNGSLTYNNPTLAAVGGALSYPSLAYTTPSLIKDQVDLLAAATMNQAKADVPVPIQLQFKHILSQVYFSAKAANSNYRIDVKEIKVEGVVKGGTYTYDATVGTWTLGTDVAAYTYMSGTSGYIGTTSALIPSAGVGATAGGQMMLIPQTATETFKLTVKYDIVNPSNTTKLASDVVKSANMEALLQGKKYNYLLTLPIDASPAVPITFTVGVADWENSTIDMSFSVHNILGTVEDATKITDEMKAYTASADANANIRTIEMKGKMTTPIAIDLTTVDNAKMANNDYIVLDFSAVEDFTTVNKVTITVGTAWTADKSELTAAGKIKLTKKVI